MRKKSSSFLRWLEEELGVRLCVYEEVNCLSKRMCKCGTVWDVGGDQLCFCQAKQSSEIPISKIHEATRPTVASSSSVAGSRGGGNLAGAGAGAASGSVSRNPQFGSLWVGGILARRDQKLAFAAKSAEVQKGAEDMALSHKYTQTSLRWSIVLASSNMPTIQCHFLENFFKRWILQNLRSSALFIRLSWHWRML